MGGLILWERRGSVGGDGGGIMVRTLRNMSTLKRPSPQKVT